MGAYYEGELKYSRSEGKMASAKGSNFQVEMQSTCGVKASKKREEKRREAALVKRITSPLC